MKSFFYLATLGFLSFLQVQSCKEKESSTTSTESTTTTTESTTTITPVDAPPVSTQTTTAVVDQGTAPMPTAEFKIKQSPEDANGTPHADISLLCNGQSTPIAKIAGEARMYEKSDYAEMGIPAAALSACGAWWAGAGDYYYMMAKGDQFEIFQGWQAEEQTDKGYHWKKMKNCP